MLKFLKLSAALAMSASPVFAEGFGLGRAALPEEIAAWDLDVSPDGTGLPKGVGDALLGEEIFADKCAACHGDFAEGVDNWPKLAVGWDALADDDPLKTVGSYWPYLSTTWDYVNRSMPFGAAQTLEADEVYVIVAYILYSYDLVDEDFVASDQTFAEFELPNQDGFIVDDRIETEHALWVGEPCMENCKAEVKVRMRAMVLDVTPDEGVSSEDETIAEAAAVPVIETAQVDPVLIKAGARVFCKRKACHQIGDGAKNRSGRILTGVVDRAAGSVEGFKYSKSLKAMAEDVLVWDEERLNVFLTKHKAFMKGTKMSFARIKKEADLEAITANLKSIPE
ncbi:MAG: c-type cytochrome [Aliishimia sp.]